MRQEVLEILQSGIDVTINMNSGDLRDFGRYLINAVAEEAKERIKAGEEDILLSVDDVMKRLGVKDRTTLWRWQKKGYLIPVRAGKKILYKQSDVEELLSRKKAEY